MPTTVLAGSISQYSAIESLAPFGHDDQKLDRPAAVAPRRMFCNDAATESRFSAVRRGESPSTEATTRMAGVRRYLVSVLATLAGSSPRASIAAAATLPSWARASPVSRR